VVGIADVLSTSIVNLMLEFKAVVQGELGRRETG
jgi:hypothetical protein